MFSITTPATNITAKLAVLLATLALVFTGTQVFAAEPVNTLEKSGLFRYKPSGLAIRGADTVAYFTEKKYVPGSDRFITEWNGAVWQFSSQENLDKFIASPEEYAPQYGGYCAYGVSQNYLVKIEPENWTIVDGKLYLNSDQGAAVEIEELPGQIDKAESNWPKIRAALLEEAE